jgi:NAD(P)-dependent dehydrogenase (short-subunit alcohol dehydrogenase family)
VGLTREVGLLAVYLSSSAASYVTGQSIGIDGGRTLL